MASDGTFGRNADQNRTVTYGSASRRQQGPSSEAKDSFLANRKINGASFASSGNHTMSSTGKASSITSLHKQHRAAQSPQAQPDCDPYDFEPVSPNDKTNDKPNGKSNNTIRKRKHSSAFSAAKRPPKDVPNATIDRYLTGTRPKDPNRDARGVRHVDDDNDKAGVETMKSTSVRPSTNPPSARPERRRLIDTLVAQRPKTPDSDSDDNNSTPSGTAIEGEASSIPRSDSPKSSLVHSQTPERRITFAKNKKIKMTYSQSRVTIASRPRGEDLAQPDKPVDGASALSDIDGFSAPPSPSAWDDDDDDDDTSLKVGIRSVHELRRAGANNRFADEMDDILARVSTPSAKPSTMRRNALCEVAQKLRRKDFMGQFRDHAARDKIVKNIQEEHDVISGFALVSALVIFLSAGPAPHLLRQLASERIGKLLSQLLSLPDDILDIASRKEMNVPKATKTSLGSIKTHLLELPLWHGCSLNEMSPRTLSLQLLDVLGRCSEPRQLEEICQDLETAMDSVSAFQAHSGLDDSIDYILTVFALEAQSILMPIRGGPQSHSVSNFLDRTLKTWPRQQQNLVDRTTLKLSINMTNNEKNAATFNEASTILSLTRSISIGFAAVKEAVDSDRFQTEVYDELLLLLGIVINLLEHCPAVRTTVQEESVRSLVTIWTSNMASVNEADSVGKSKLSVAFGYLSITLGYLYLTSSGQQIMQQHADWPGISRLVDSIRDFLSMYKSINSKMHEVELLIEELRHKQIRATTANDFEPGWQHS